MKGSLSLTILLLAASVRAAPPPPAGELQQLLEREPLSLQSWPAWSPRLREWSSEHYQAAFPAYRAAFGLVRRELTASKVKPLPAPLHNDPVAYMVLAGSYLNDAESKDGPVVRGRAAADAARRAVKGDSNLARAHFYLMSGIQMEQFVPPDQGGPGQPDHNRLREALTALKRARELRPDVAWLPHLEAADLAERAQKLDDAEISLKLALKEKPDAETARRLARAIIDQQFPQYRRGEPYAASLAPLIAGFPQDGVLASLNVQALMYDKRSEEAAKELARARSLGVEPARVIPAGLIAQVDREHEQRQVDQSRRNDEAKQRQAEEDFHNELTERPLQALHILGWCAAGFTGFYLAVMALMCLTGVLLARQTRSPIERELEHAQHGAAPVRGQAVRTLREASVTRWYALALFAGLVLFYFALPFVFVGLLLLLLLMIVFVALAGRGDRGDVHGDLLRASGGGVSAVFKALFARSGASGFGVRKTRAQCPKLFAAIDEVARKIDTEPPDEVWISPGAEFSVCQRGRGPFGAFGGKRRVLTLGLCVLHFLTQNEFKSILAHEFAHFSHADTYWHRFIYQVSLSLRTALREMARTGGWVTWVNPFYWFFWMYSRSYSLLAAGFSRSREFLADRMACTHYGSDVFGAALEKVCIDGGQFEKVIYKNIAHLLAKNQAFVNMYLAFRKYREGQAGERQDRVNELVVEAPSLFDTHPSYAQRIAAARRLPAARQLDQTSALHLFNDIEQIERELTDYLTAALAAH